jgi:hypothetical protein|tara:strand:+ start:286 stop:483 length:198 start_codon:yes stop_codon:yes gene_type:complete
MGRQKKKKEIKKRSLLSGADPQTILLFFIYILGFICHGGVSIFKWLVKKQKEKVDQIEKRMPCMR